MTAPVDARSLRGWTWTAATRGMLAAIEAVNSPPSPPSTHTRHKPRASKRSLVVLDYWEKLAGASLALSAIVRLCQNANISLVAPTVRSSLFLPSGGWPLSSYYDISALRAVLAPQQLISFKRVRSRAASISVVAVIYSDFPLACRTAMAASSIACPAACLAAAGLRRLINTARDFIGDEPLLPSRLRCASASAVRAAIIQQGGAFFQFLRQTPNTVALLNFRRHDDGKPMLPPAQALALRARAVRPSPTVRSAASHFLATNKLSLDSGHALVQLRSNHLAHSAYLATRGSSSSGSDGQSGTAKPQCTQRIAACARRLGRAARRLAPPSRTVVASDLSTLFAANQDGASHHKHAYMRQCLLPSLPALRKWHSTAGLSFQPSVNCNSSSGAGGGRRGRPCRAGHEPVRCRLLRTRRPRARDRRVGVCRGRCEATVEVGLS